MKVAVCYEFGQPLVIEEIEIDPPQVGEIKVKLAACAICHSDIHYMEGAWGGTLPVGKECGHDEDEWPGRTEAIVPAIRSALGDEATLLVDANCCYTPKKAIEVGRMLEDHGISHFEEPCPYWEFEWTAEVTQALEDLNIDVAGGEQD